MVKKKDTLVKETEKIKVDLEKLREHKKENRTCKEICKKFIVKKPTSGSRYDTGQGRCQTCDVWIDYRGAHMKDGSPAAIDSVGWFCDCCNFRIRQKPRNKVYKEKLAEDIAQKEKNSLRIKADAETKTNKISSIQNQIDRLSARISDRARTE